ncbi:alpha/beta-hydrolase [Sarocladium strictum]
MSSNLSGHVTVSEDPAISIFYKASSPVTEKPVIVVSHSLAAATWLWDSFVDKFEADYSIVSYDIRYHGESSALVVGDDGSLPTHTIEDLAADVIKLLDHLDVTQAEAFLGLSIGGGIATVIAAQFADRFRHVIPVGSRSSASPGDETAWNARIALAREKGMPVVAKQSVERWFPAEWRLANPALAAEFAERVGRQSVEGFIANVQALRVINLIPHAEQIARSGNSQRVLFVVGADDMPPVVTETKAMATAAGSKVEIVEGAGHIVHVAQPQVFFDLVEEFLKT